MSIKRIGRRHPGQTRGQAKFHDLKRRREKAFSTASLAQVVRGAVYAEKRGRVRFKLIGKLLENSDEK